MYQICFRIDLRSTVRSQQSRLKRTLLSWSEVWPIAAEAITQTRVVLSAISLLFFNPENLRINLPLWYFFPTRIYDNNSRKLKRSCMTVRLVTSVAAQAYVASWTLRVYLMKSMFLFSRSFASNKLVETDNYIFQQSSRKSFANNSLETLNWCFLILKFPLKIIFCTLLVDTFFKSTWSQHGTKR